MPNILVRDLPEPVHTELTRRARASGQSLQQFLTQQLTRLSEQPTLEEVLHRAAQRHGGTVGLGQAVHDLDELRGQR